MVRSSLRALLLAGFAALLGLPQATASGLEPDPARVTEISKYLLAKPKGPGVPAIDRAVWGGKSVKTKLGNLIPQAEKLAATPIPDQPDDLYLDYSKTGNRTRFQQVAGERRGRLVTLSLAEAQEGKKRFIPALEAIVKAICAEKTWVLPAHDGALKNFKGQIVEIDLVSSHLAWDMALVNWLLGDSLSPEVRQLIRDNVSRRVLNPFADMIHGKRTTAWWLLTNNNWNAVCLAGVTGAALAQVESADERAFYIAAAEKASTSFLKGFTKDGYCSEGVGYWNYGFGNYVQLCDAIADATDGKVDLLARPEAAEPARYGMRIGINDGVCPAFSDCDVHAAPDALLMDHLNRRLGLGLPKSTKEPKRITGGLGGTLVFAFANAPSHRSKSKDAGPGLRTWFAEAGVYIGRPATGGGEKLAVALKGGNNNENHNHNDIGSYVVVRKGKPVLLDPGAETYTARTFSNRRYDSKLLSSFGHSVPRIDGQLQRTGAAAKGIVLATQFSDAKDSLTFDISSAYTVPGLAKLTRTFTYERAGTFTITDEFASGKASQFETALLTLGKWEQITPGRLRVWDGEASLDVFITVTGSAFMVASEEIIENAPVKPTRISIRLTDPTNKATVKVAISPSL
jgi:hypothetical protein